MLWECFGLDGMEAGFADNVVVKLGLLWLSDEGVLGSIAC